MSEYRFRPIRPRTPNSTVSAVEEPDNNSLNEVLIKRRSVACTECQRRRTKVRKVKLIVLSASDLVIENSALLETRA